MKKPLNLSWSKTKIDWVKPNNFVGLANKIENKFFSTLLTLVNS